MPRRKISTSLATQSVGIRLSSHEKICAERMKNLLTSIERLEKNPLQQWLNKVSE